MHRLLFEKKGNSVWISHLDLMRLFQRAFKRSGLLLTHTQGFNPRPSVSIALPLSVGVESVCELLDFELDGFSGSCSEILPLLNDNLIEGITVREVYECGRKIRDIALLKCEIRMEYDRGIPDGAIETIRSLFSQEELMVEKKSKNGITQQNIVPMIHKMDIFAEDENTVFIESVICCQNPSLNPAQIPGAIQRYIPEFTPDFVKCNRMEIYDINMNVFR